MKISYVTLIFFFLTAVVKAQENEPIKLVTIDGETILLANSSEDKIIIDDPGGTFNDRTIFKGRLMDGEKFKIEKSRISTVTKNGQIYRALPDSDGEYHLGTFISKGKINVFQTYVFRSIPSAQGNAGSYQTILLYEYDGDKIQFFGKSKKLKALMQECEELKKYVKQNRIVKQDEYVFIAFDYYNDFCGK